MRNPPVRTLYLRKPVRGQLHHCKPYAFRYTSVPKQGNPTGYNQSVTGCGSQRKQLVVVTQRKLM